MWAQRKVHALLLLNEESAAETVAGHDCLEICIIFNKEVMILVVIFQTFILFMASLILEFKILLQFCLNKFNNVTFLIES